MMFLKIDYLLMSIVNAKDKKKFDSDAYTALIEVRLFKKVFLSCLTERIALCLQVMETYGNSVM